MVATSMDFFPVPSPSNQVSRRLPPRSKQPSAAGALGRPPRRRAKAPPRIGDNVATTLNGAPKVFLK